VHPDVDLPVAVRALARASRLLERASGELSLPQYRVLAAVAAGDERASRVAQRLALGKPTISAAVESLAGRGYLLRTEVRDDHRAVALAVTEHGRAALAATEHAMVRQLAALLEHADDRDCVLAGLAALGEALDRLSAARAGAAVR
jgi:DNA-binding MarR family transcriptional regulator